MLITIILACSICLLFRLLNGTWSGSHSFSPGILSKILIGTCGNVAFNSAMRFSCSSSASTSSFIMALSRPFFRSASSTSSMSFSPHSRGTVGQPWLISTGILPCRTCSIRHASRSQCTTYPKSMTLATGIIACTGSSTRSVVVSLHCLICVSPAANLTLTGLACAHSSCVFRWRRQCVAPPSIRVCACMPAS